MASSIWKWPLTIDDVQEVRMPIGAKVIHVAEQDGQLCLWGIVAVPATDDGFEMRRFRIVGTGHIHHTIPRHTHCGTALMRSGLVWHVFDEGLANA